MSKMIRFIVLLKQGHLLAALRQVGGRGQPGDSSADDDGIAINRVLHNPYGLSDQIPAALGANPSSSSFWPYSTCARAVRTKTRTPQMDIAAL